MGKGAARNGRSAPSAYRRPRGEDDCDPDGARRSSRSGGEGPAGAGRGATAGARIAGGYAPLLAATALYDLVPKPVALVIAALIATAGVAVSLAWRAQTVAAIGLVGATLVPALVAFDGGLTRIGTAFVALVL